MDEKVKGILWLGAGGVFLIVIGVIAILNINPYTDNCGWMDFFCEEELKTPLELFGDHIFPVFLIVLGSIAILILIITQTGILEKHLDKRRSAQTSLSEEEKEKIQERVKNLKSGKSN